MRYGTVCSGVEAFGPAWEAMGYECAFHAEIATHPSAVLRYHYPDVPNHGDFTTIHTERIDLLAGGTPCQDFSVAGLRAGMAGKRGNLTLEFAGLAERLRPRWLVWENVPGVLSADGGRAFGQFLTLLAECGYYAAYRVLDAQHFGIGQRRRRVFVVACSHGWQGGAAVLFNPQSLSGDSAPTPGNVYPTLDCNTIGAKWQSNQWCRNGFAIRDAFGVRKATPVECERLQGWADDWTKHGIDEVGSPYLLPDDARYEIIGNGWPSPVVEWLGQRIKEIDSFLPQVL